MATASALSRSIQRISGGKHDTAKHMMKNATYSTTCSKTMATMDAALAVTCRTEGGGNREWWWQWAGGVV